MKVKFIGAVVAGFFLVVGSTSSALTLQQEGLKFKSWNWEISTGYVYSESLIGKTLFRNEAVPGYDPSNPNHKTFQEAINSGELTIVHPVNKGLRPGEDAWGLFHVTIVLGGTMNTTGTDIIQREPPYWYIGDGGRYLQGMFWGLQDQRVEIIASGLVRIYSTGLQFNLYDTGNNGGVGDNYNPNARDLLAVDDRFPGWVDAGPGDILQAAGHGAWSRFIGDTDATGVDGQTLVYLDVTEGDWLAQGLAEVWNITQGDVNGLYAPLKKVEIYQTWSIVGDFRDPWIRSEDAGRGFLAEEEFLGCRVTGGGVDESTGLWDGTLAEAKSNNPNGPIDSYRFGGQAGAPTGCQPQPWGEWTHHQQSGPDGSFVFHAGTASAPPGTEIDWIECADPGWCVEARPAPAKQINFTGVGTFKNMKKPSARLSNVVVGKTFHWFEVHIEDLGEPGKGGKVDPPAPQCPPEGSESELADCACPDFYRITIYEAFYPPAEPNKTTIIYEVFGYIRGGNLQIHPPLPCK